MIKVAHKISYLILTVWIFNTLILHTLARPADAVPHDGGKNNIPSINAANHGIQVTVKNYGARGDGLTDDTAAIQKAVDDIYHKGGGTILFPAGTYIVRSVDIRENIIYQGENATIKRPEKQGKWTRTFTTQKYAYSGYEDSKPLIIRNLAFDGNIQNQGNYQKWELEQAHLIFLMAKPDKPGRLRAIIENCRFKDCVADAIDAYTNVNLEVYNCEAENIFRCGVVVGGGHSKLYVKNFTSRGKINRSGVHTEVDGYGFGHTFAIDVILEDLNLLDGQCELGFSAGSTLVAKRIKSSIPPSGQYNFVFAGGGGNGKYEFNDCVFYTTPKDYIIDPGTVTFNRCKFIATDDGNKPEIHALPLIFWKNNKLKNQSVILNNCLFTAADPVNPKQQRFGITYTATSSKDNNLLQIHGGEFTNKLDRAIGSPLGGKIILSGVTFNVDNSAGSYPLYLSGYDGSYNWDVTIDHCKFNTKNYIYIYGYSETYPCDNNYLRQGNVVIKKETNNIGTFAGIISNNYLGLGKKKVMRIIEGIGPPSNTPGFISKDGFYFDQYKDITNKTNPIYYKCISMNPYSWDKYIP